MMKKSLIGFISGLVLLSACRKMEKDQSANQDKIPVRMIQVEYRELSRPIQSTGFVSAREESKLSFKIGGLIDTFYKGEGDRVKKGEILASLKLDEIQAMAAQAGSAFEKAQRDFKRAENLYADNVATLEQVQNARTGMEVARAQMNIAEFNLEHARILAPNNGKILKKLAERHELIGPGYPVFLFAAGSKDWIIRIGMPDVDVVRCKPGDRAEMILDAYPEEMFAASVFEIAGAPDPMSGLFEVSLHIEKTEKSLMTGFVGRVRIFPSDRKQVAVVPMISLVYGHEHHGFVYTVKDSLAVRLPVELMFLMNDQAALSKGLSGVTEVVADGASYLRPGSVVEIITP